MADARPSRGRFALLLVAAALIVAAPSAVVAFPSKLTTNGKLDFTYGSLVKSAGGVGTASKPESKLFYTGGDGLEPIRWWSVLGTSGPAPAAGVWIWELEEEDHTWDPEVQLPQADPWAKADTVFDDGTLYVSTRDDRASETGNPRESSLYRIPYLGAGTWGEPLGPTVITTSNVETLTIARDSAGRLWTTYEMGSKIRVGSTTPLGTTFTFSTLSQTNVKGDDISSVTAFAGNRIGVFWSDQNARKDVFAWRSDLAPISMSSWTIETAYGGGVGGCPTITSPLCADDHMNVKVFQDQVYVAIKTSLNDASPSSPLDPQVALLRRDPDGTWSAFAVSPVAQNATRPIVVLDPSESTLWVWATRGSEIDVWESPFASPSFDSSGYVPWVKGVTVNDATSTKQVSTDATGAVVMVSAGGKKQYWHNEFLPD